MNKPTAARYRWMIAVAFAMATYSVHAQIQLGVKLGTNSDFVRTNGVTWATHPISTIGYHAGLFGRTHLKDDWSFIGEIQFIRKGSRSIFPQLPMKERVNFEYFDLSALPCYRLTNRLTLEAGPTITIQTRLFFSEAIVSPSEPIQFAMNIGARFNITQQIALVARYYHALTPFQNYRVSNSLNQYEGTSQFYYRTMEASVVYIFKKKNA